MSLARAPESLYLIVQVQVVKLPVGPELLSVVVQSEVDIPAVALYDNRVPVVIIEQAPAGHRGVTLNGAVLVTAWRRIKQITQTGTS